MPMVYVQPLPLLYRALLRLSGVVRVFYGPDFVTVTKTDDDTLDWLELKAEVLATITDFLASGLPIVEEGAELASTATGTSVLLYVLSL